MQPACGQRVAVFFILRSCEKDFFSYGHKNRKSRSGVRFMNVFFGPTPSKKPYLINLRLLVLFAWILYVTSTIFQLCWDVVS